MKWTQRQFSRRRSKSRFFSVLTEPRIGRALIVCLALSGRVWTVHADPSLTLKESATTMVGHRVSDFKLKDLEDRQVALSDFKDKGVIVLFVMGKGCPVANLYLAELKKLQNTYEKKGLQIIG